VVQNRAYLGWREETETHQCPARLLNISSGGVLIFTEESPEQGQTAWICLEDPAATEWVKANVISVVKVPGLRWFWKASYGPVELHRALPLHPFQVGDAWRSARCDEARAYCAGV
jgi:hypothetical protein